jgi:hypothetical protein
MVKLITKITDDSKIPFYKTLKRGANVFLKERYGETPIIGVELGVYVGHNSYELLNNLNFSKLYLVDAWDSEINSTWGTSSYSLDHITWGKEALDSVYSKIVERFGEHKNVEIIRAESGKATEYIEDNYCDFVFIDAAHSYKAVLRDCQLWYPKIKSGGILCGHDLLLDDVRNAVDTFSQSINSHYIVVYSEIDPGDGPCFILIKE